MTELFVTCPECGLCEELAHTDWEFNDPQTMCGHRLSPAKCPALQLPLIAARRILDILDWEATWDAEDERPISPSFVEASIVPDMPNPSGPLAESIASEAAAVSEAKAPFFEPDDGLQPTPLLAEDF